MKQEQKRVADPSANSNLMLVEIALHMLVDSRMAYQAVHDRLKIGGTCHTQCLFFLSDCQQGSPIWKSVELSVAVVAPQEISIIVPAEHDFGADVGIRLHSVLHQDLQFPVFKCPTQGITLYAWNLRRVFNAPKGPNIGVQSIQPPELLVT
ncbi:MAG: hypothetical protein HYY24_10070 [Verrucomicrobia bacterium]|nr:hypothetical protein [Verrucomicrobiota bacterium]